MRRSSRRRGSPAGSPTQYSAPHSGHRAARRV